MRHRIGALHPDFHRRFAVTGSPVPFYSPSLSDFFGSHASGDIRRGIARGLPATASLLFRDHSAPTPPGVARDFDESYGQGFEYSMIYYTNLNRIFRPVKPGAFRKSAGYVHRGIESRTGGLGLPAGGRYGDRPSIENTRRCYPWRATLCRGRGIRKTDVRKPAPPEDMIEDSFVSGVPLDGPSGR